MSIGKANCAICGSPLEYFQSAQDVTCTLCGKKETGHNICVKGHYVCDTCHRKKGVEHILETCKKSTQTDPVALCIELAGDRSIYPNGPEHHTLVGAALITAYANAGGNLNKDEALDEMKKRSLNLPGGTCGFWGVCGAAASAGQALSIINGSTPMTRVPWAQCQRLTSNILGKLAELGGPRCCKRVSFTALLESADYIARIMGVQMDTPEVVECTFYPSNAECLKDECPYFPSNVRTQRTPTTHIA